MTRFGLVESCVSHVSHPRLADNMSSYVNSIPTFAYPFLVEKKLRCCRLYFERVLSSLRVVRTNVSLKLA